MDSQAYFRGIQLFNEAEFFQAHEVLEDVWREAGQPERRFLQGLIQVAVALHHHSQGNAVGARSLLARAARNLSGYPEAFGGLHLQELRAALEAWQQALAEGRLLPAPPKLRMLESVNS